MSFQNIVILGCSCWERRTPLTSSRYLHWAFSILGGLSRNSSLSTGAQASWALQEHLLAFTPGPRLSLPISKATGETLKGELHSSTPSASVVPSALKLWSSPERGV